MEPPRMATNSQRPADSSFKSVQIWEIFYKIDATTRSIGPRSTKPKNCKPKIGHTRLHALPKSLDKSWPSPSKLCKSTHYFWKLTTPLDPSTSDLQDPKISGPEDKPRASGIIGASFMRHLTQPRAWRAKRWHVPSAHDVMDDIILQYLGLTWTDLETWPGSNRLQKKKLNKKKRRKRKSFDQVELWLWPKSQNFQKGPVPFRFSSTFRFWDPFLHLKLENCANCPIPKKLTFAQILTKSQNFQEIPVLPNFSRRFQFWGLFLHSRIQNCSNIMILQLLALMWTLTKNQDVRAKLVLFRFSHRFWLWNPLICFGLGNHLCDPLPRSTNSVQKLSFLSKYK